MVVKFACSRFKKLATTLLQKMLIRPSRQLLASAMVRLIKCGSQQEEETFNGMIKSQKKDTFIQINGDVKSNLFINFKGNNKFNLIHRIVYFNNFLSISATQIKEFMI